MKIKFQTGWANRSSPLDYCLSLSTWHIPGKSILLSLHAGSNLLPNEIILSESDLEDPDLVLEFYKTSDGKFDWQAYIKLPIGQRLLTKSEVDALPQHLRRTIPQSDDDPDWGLYEWDCVQGDNELGRYLWGHNWDPVEQKPVYPNGSIPYRMRIVTDIYDGEDKGRWFIDAWEKFCKTVQENPEVSEKLLDIL